MSVGFNNEDKCRQCQELGKSIKDKLFIIKGILRVYCLLKVAENTQHFFSACFNITNNREQATLVAKVLILSCYFILKIMLGIWGCRLSTNAAHTQVFVVVGWGQEEAKDSERKTQTNFLLAYNSVFHHFHKRIPCQNKLYQYACQVKQRDNTII